MEFAARIEEECEQIGEEVNEEGSKRKGKPRLRRVQKQAPKGKIHIEKDVKQKTLGT